MNERITKLVEELNKASDLYYAGETPIMSDYEWDSKFNELKELEEKTGYILPNSPTQTTGTSNPEADGRKELHEYPALSLNKTKDIEELKKWAGVRAVWLSWKLDGITLVATYDFGRLTKLMTRGNGTIGTNVTWLARYIFDLPLKISDMGHVVIRGEALITYKDFDRVNDDLPEGTEPYENPRNLVAGTLSLGRDKADVVKSRHVMFRPFTLVHVDKRINSWGDRMDYLVDLGFIPVEHEKTNSKLIGEVVYRWSKSVGRGEINYPVDGLVIVYDDTEYAASGSVNGRFATNAGLAYKWRDTVKTTTLRDVEWMCGVGHITPVAVFDPIRLEGTTVRRASLCNVSEMHRLGIGANDITTLKIIKSNMIIPKCIEADAHGTKFTVPSTCPVCGAPTEIQQRDILAPQILRCTNPDCTAKQVRKFSRFVSKSGLDINGLSTKSLMKLINMGLIKSFPDIFQLYKFKDYVWETDGFGARQFDKILDQIENSRYVKPSNFLYSLCIPMIGEDASKKIVDSLGTNGMLRAIMVGTDLSDISGIGFERSNAVREWMEDDNNQDMLHDLLNEVTVANAEPVPKGSGACDGMIFVITGSLNRYGNRQELKGLIESMGGRVSESMSRSTTFLINNDLASMSSKNRKAMEYNIPILTEDDFVDRFVEPRVYL